MPLTDQQQQLLDQRVNVEGRSTGLAYALAIVAGGLGIHRFYLGRAGSGVTMLLLTIFGLLTAKLLFGIPVLIGIVFWVLVDLFLIPGIIESDRAALRDRLTAEIEMGTADAPAPARP